MPDLNEIIANRKDKKFVKKEYRPWDLSGSHRKVTDNIYEKETSKTENTDPSAPLDQINTDNIEQSSAQEKKTNFITNESNKGSLELNSGSNKSSLEFIKGSDKSSLEFNKGSDKGSLELNKGSNKSSIYDKKLISVYSSDMQINDFDALKITLARLGGNEKKIFFFIIHYCSMKGALSTGEILSSDLDMQLNLLRNSRETALKRLVAKKLVIRKHGKRGKHGTLILFVPELVKSEALNFLALSQSTENLRARVQQGFNSITYSNNKDSTTTEEDRELPKDWAEIDYEPLKEIGFSLTQLRQLYAKACNKPEIIQDSINQFAFGLEKNPDTKKYSNPLTIIMGVLRKGLSWVEKNYQSPQEIAQREFLERKKVENERLKALEEEAYKMAFEEWQSTLTLGEIEEIAPENRKKGDIVPRTVKLSLYFKEHLWPEKKNEYLIE